MECQNPNDRKQESAEKGTFFSPIPRRTHATSTSENQTSSASLDGYTVERQNPNASILDSAEIQIFVSHF